MIFRAATSIRAIAQIVGAMIFVFAQKFICKLTEKEESVILTADTKMTYLHASETRVTCSHGVKKTKNK